MALGDHGVTQEIKALLCTPPSWDAWVQIFFHLNFVFNFQISSDFPLQSAFFLFHLPLVYLTFHQCSTVTGAAPVMCDSDIALATLCCIGVGAAPAIWRERRLRGEKKERENRFIYLYIMGEHVSRILEIHSLLCHSIFLFLPHVYMGKLFPYFWAASVACSKVPKLEYCGYRCSSRCKREGWMDVWKNNGWENFHFLLKNVLPLVTWGSALERLSPMSLHQLQALYINIKSIWKFYPLLVNYSNCYIYVCGHYYGSVTMEDTSNFSFLVGYS